MNQREEVIHQTNLDFGIALHFQTICWTQIVEVSQQLSGYLSLY